MKKLLLMSAALLLLVACDQSSDDKTANADAVITPPPVESTQIVPVPVDSVKEEAAPAAEAQAAKTAKDDPNSIQGRWNGPEGTYAIIESNKVKIRNLDGEKSYAAKVVSDRATFKRDDVEETIRHGDGTETGMKWLVNKKDCIIIKRGEGYCRD